MTSKAGIKDVVEREAARVCNAATERLARTVADAQEELRRRLDSVKTAADLFEAPISVVDVLARGGAVRVAELRKETDDQSEIAVHYDGYRQRLNPENGNLDVVLLTKKGRYRITFIVERLPPDLKETTGETR